MDGILVIDKPVGPTSHDVVAKVRKVLHEKKVGHTGTLDPMATGVLPLVLGSATRIARYLAGGNKTYRAVFRLGIKTDTLDSAGEVVSERPVTVDETQVRAALAGLVGEIEQLPPMYSAKKMQGQRLYKLARQGIEVERTAKKVVIHAIDVLAFRSPDVELDVRCSVGTYVRVLALDVGERLGCGAHLHELRRLAAGPFTLEDAVGLEAVVSDPEMASARVLPVGRALQGFARVDVPADIGRMIGRGYQLTVADLKTLDTPAFATGDTVILGLAGGELIAIAQALVPSAELGRSRRERQALKTERVLLRA